jgi:hypothetical protein
LDGPKNKSWYAVVKTSGRIFGFVSMRRRNQRLQHPLLPNIKHPEAIVNLAHPDQNLLNDV